MMQSALAIYDLSSRTVIDVLTTERLIEAPNWSPDGTSLIVNGEGRLYRVSLDAPEVLEEIDTGFARNCNNDHGISPDGRSIVISDATETGQSCIYLLPAAGGAPCRVTADVPSWWHGWSPDGTTLAFTGRRDGEFGIYTIAADSGEERLLIGGGTHYDGPDYSADGAHIWFNSDRGGSMDIWRIPSGGGEAERMTSDKRADWFPHPSPDGRRVLYLSYPAGTTGHPRNRDVELRMIDLENGNIRILLALHGGQGTINVPCWAPDGGRFAYIRYGEN